jgi:hypothetical protein
VVKDHIPRVKIKIGESWGASEHRDLERVALAREHQVAADLVEVVAQPGGEAAGC